MLINEASTVIASGAGQTVQVHHLGRIRAAAVRTAGGWLATVDGTTCRVTSLDELLMVLGILPDHHRRTR